MVASLDEGTIYFHRAIFCYNISIKKGAPCGTPNDFDEIA